jgi:hypothetical protein
MIRRSDLGDPVVQKKLEQLLDTIGQFHGYIPLRHEPCGTYEETASASGYTSSGSGTYYVDPSGLEHQHPLLAAHWDKDGHFILARIARSYGLQDIQKALHLVYRIQLDVYGRKLLIGLLDRLHWFNADRAQVHQEEIGLSLLYIELEQIKKASSEIAELYTRVDDCMRGREIYQSVVDLYTSGLGLLRERQIVIRLTTPGSSRVWSGYDHLESDQDLGHAQTPQFLSMVSDRLLRFADDTSKLRVVFDASTAVSRFETEFRVARSMNPFSSYIERLERALPTFQTIASQVDEQLKDVEKDWELSITAERVYFKLINSWVYCMATIYTTELELIEHYSTETDTLWPSDTLWHQKATEFVNYAESRVTNLITRLSYDSFTAFYNLRCMIGIGSHRTSEWYVNNPQTRWVSGAHMDRRGHGVAIIGISKEEGTGEYKNGPITLGPYPDVYFQEIFPTITTENTPMLPTALWSLVMQYDDRLRVVRPVAPRAIRQRHMPLYNTPVQDDDITLARQSIFGGTERTSLSVAAALLRGPNMHPQNIEVFRRLGALDGRTTSLPRGCLLFTTLPDTFDETTLRPGSRCILPDQPFFLDPVAALHSSYQHVAHQNRASFWDPPRDRISMEEYLLARRHVPLVVHMFGQGTHPVISGLPIRDKWRRGVSEVTLTEGTVLESTVTWCALVDLGFMSSAESPYGTYWNVDFCRLIVCNTRVSG